MGQIHAPHWKWRVSKYDPLMRDATGAYLGNGWTFAAQVGTVIDGHRLTLDEYLAVEDKYVSVAVQFVAESGLTSLRVENVQNRFTTKSLKQAKHGLAHPFVDDEHMLDIHDEDEFTSEAIKRACQLNLREFLHCDLCAPNQFALSFGWDYYMIIASVSPCLASIRHARDLGLFVEEIHAPPPGIE